MDIQDLHKLYLLCNGVSTDTRNIKQGNLFFALKGDNFNGNSYAEDALNKGAKYAVIDDGTFANIKNTILVDNVLETLQRLATFHRNYHKTTVVALTGSNGKTTTKELINAVLSQKFETLATQGNLNNHIGVPLTLLRIEKKTEIAIIEMGANHQKEIAFLSAIARPDYGYITNYGKAHLEGFGGVEGVIKGKSELYDYLSNNQKTAIVNAEDPIQIEKTKNIKRFTFGSNHANSQVHIDFLGANPFVICTFKDQNIKTQLIGAYNYTNICAAIAIGTLFGVDAKAIKKAIETYVPSNNRSQIINKGSFKIILDAYNANPSSMRAALMHFETQPGLKIAILGDMFELGNDAEMEHQTIADLAVSLPIDKIYFVGSNFFKCKIENENAEQFKSFEDLKMHLKTLKLVDSTLFIKGSRGMALERVLDSL